MNKLKQVVLHPDFRTISGRFTNNIALVQLQEAVSFIDTMKPMLLPSPRDVFSTDTECWVTGWGNVAVGRPLGGNQTLQELQVSLVDDATCHQINPFHTDSQLCAGDLREGKSACSGDGGAPLVCVLAGDAERRFVQVGLVSFWGCDRRENGDIYTNVLHFTQFIRDTIEEAECNNLPPFEACFL
ncbi:testisin-like [Alosa sapidissima]|uniref:testisin-like n=1 Tax=Alosa sapidissima TaxID=34773 RepID=UPI001C088418|nr:testisin-like [Alosa sapidissima]